MEKTLEDIGIYTDIYRTEESDGKGHRLYHVRCKVCNKELYYTSKAIRKNHAKCTHIKEDIPKEIGIYKDICESGNRTKSGYKLYNATCTVCGTIVEKKLADIKESNTLCRHKVLNKDSSNRVNDMPKGWMNQSELNMRIYHTWKSMIARTTKKFWDKYPTYIGTTVDDKWRFLSNFVNDIKELDGYNEWVNSAGEMMMLDKDTIIDGNKHYSKNTCRFITHTESNQDVFRRHPEGLEKARDVFKENASEPVRFINIKTNEMKDFPSLKEACRTLNLNLRNAWMVLSDKYPGHHTIKGWTISKI